MSAAFELSASFVPDRSTLTAPAGSNIGTFSGNASGYMTPRKKNFTAGDFRRLALAMDDAIEGAHMGHPDFRANGRIFATIAPDRQRGMVKLTPEQQQVFVAGNPQTFEPASGAWGRQGCTMVQLASVDEETLGEAMTLAWQNAVAAPRPSRARAKRKR
jgi:hypothetical protein